MTASHHLWGAGRVGLLFLLVHSFVLIGECLQVKEFPGRCESVFAEWGSSVNECSFFFLRGNVSVAWCSLGGRGQSEEMGDHNSVTPFPVDGHKVMMSQTYLSGHTESVMLKEGVVSVLRGVMFS